MCITYFAGGDERVLDDGHHLAGSVHGLGVLAVLEADLLTHI
jgi:hypothetical protein